LTLTLAVLPSRPMNDAVAIVAIGKIDITCHQQA
jgi:hypothetical protein